MILVILKTTAIVGGISGLLALILVIADRFLSNYGICIININNKKDLKVEGGESLLDSLTDQKIYLSSACGGRGSCGFCKCKVDDGAGPLLPTEKPFLSDAEIKQNIRLACQIKVKQNLKITIPEEIFNIRKYKAEIIEINECTYDIKEIKLKLIEPQSISFKAGQYVQLQSPKYGKIKQSVSRAYSISSSPVNENFIQLIIRKVPDGICTTWVHDFLKIGDIVNFTGPFGDFYIRDTENDMFFVAGGSGKAPIKSMIEFLNKNKSKRHMTYFFGARSTKDLYYTDYFTDFENKLEDFKYIPILSRPTEECDWSGRCGYIPPLFKEFIRDPKKTEVYICGSPGMIAAVQKGLNEIGVPEENVFYDKF